MAKNRDRELPPDPPLNPVIDPNASDFQDQVDRHEHAVENIDRAAIDNIILSMDVNKGGKIRVERKGATDSQYYWIQSIPAEEWAKNGTDGMMEFFKTTFGGGDYRCMTHRANGQTYKQFSFAIDRRYKGALDEEQIRQMKPGSGSVMVVPPAAPDGFKAADMLKMMEMNNSKSDQMMALVMTMMTKSQESMVAMMTAMFSAVGARQPAAAPGLDPVIAEILKQKVERSPMTEVLETMRALKELQEPITEPKEEDMFSKILKAASAVLPAITGGAAPPAAPNAQIPEGQPPGGGVVGALPMAIRLGIGQLLKAARRGGDPALYADIIIDQFDDPAHYATFKAILTDPGWKAKLFGDEQSTADIAPWLEELRQLLVSYDPATDNSPAAGGNPLPAKGPAGSDGGPTADTPIS